VDDDPLESVTSEAPTAAGDPAPLSADGGIDAPPESALEPDHHPVRFLAVVFLIVLLALVLIAAGSPPPGGGCGGG
jgi:hypothetical protein